MDWLGDPDPWYSEEMAPSRADVDGREDVVVHNKNDQTIEIHLSKTLADSAAPVFELSYTLSPDRDLTKVVTGDFDGDGRVDVAGIAADGNFLVWRQRGDEGAGAGDGPDAWDVDLLTKVGDEDHHAPRETVRYRRADPILIAGEAYARPGDLGAPPEPDCSTAAYPTSCLRRGGLIVASRHGRLQPRPDDPEAMRTVGCDYFYPSVDLNGRGFRGSTTRGSSTWAAASTIRRSGAS